MSRDPSFTKSLVKADKLEARNVAITGNVTNTMVAATASTLSVTEALHAGKIVALNRAAGIVVTLPAASGSGNKYEFVCSGDVTSNSYKIQVASSDDVIAGALIVTNEADGTTTPFGTAATSDTITLNGGTTGGLVGGIITIIDVADGVFAVAGVVVGTGGEATPFSAAV